MSKGLFLIDREMFDHPVVGIKNPDKFSAWCWMLGEARWKPWSTMVGGAVVKIERGQLTCSLRFMAKRVGMSVQRVRTFLKQLETNTMINTDTSSGQMVITICKYNDYQDFREYRKQVEAHQLTQQQHSSNTAATQTITPEETPEGTPEPQIVTLSGFDLFWENFPRQRRGNKAKAKSAYLKALRENRATEDEIADGLERYANSQEVANGFAKGAVAWLNDDRWANDYTPPRQTSGGQAQEIQDVFARQAQRIRDAEQ